MVDRPTYADIARHAGVSTASVSRALSSTDGVSPEVAERVRRSAAALGYRGNRAARALRRQRADAIGLVISDVENPFFASIARAVEGVRIRHGRGGNPGFGGFVGVGGGLALGFRRFFRCWRDRNFGTFRAFHAAFGLERPAGRCFRPVLRSFLRGEPLGRRSVTLGLKLREPRDPA